MAPERPVSILELADALILFDSLMLDQRFQQAIAHHPSAEVRERLARLPAEVAEGSRVTRRAIVKWEIAHGEGVDDRMLLKSELFLLNAVLQAAEEQIRLKVFLARHAPTREVRELLEEALRVHRLLSGTLRDALKQIPLPEPETPEVAAWSPTKSADEEHPTGDLRGQIEAELRRLRDEGIAPRIVLLSPTAFRHLRDQGLFHDGSATVHGVPVMVEFAWRKSEYAISTFDSLPLDELLAGPGAR